MMVQVHTDVSAHLATWEPAAKFILMSVAQTPAKMGRPALWVHVLLICESTIVSSVHEAD